jgi:hypothetical protein
MTARSMMDSDQIRRAITRLGHEIVERHCGTDRLILIGIQRRGVVLAQRLADAIAAISAPPTATPGETLAFTVALTNLGDRAAPLDPCPTCTEDLIVDGRGLKFPAVWDHRLLNCPMIGPETAPGESL